MAFRDPEQNKQYMQAWYQRNKERLRPINRERQRFYRAASPEARERGRMNAREWKAKRLAEDAIKWPALWNRRERIAKRKARIECFQAYGNRCACCGETQREFLSIDHIHGGGTKARQNGFPAGTRLYARLRTLGYPADFRLLCHNCNQAIGFHGACPHEGRRQTHAVTLSDFELGEVIGL